MLIRLNIVWFSTSIDTITLTRPVKDGDVLVSNGETFALGFFSPINSTNCYVGIWSNKVSEQTVVWVANRDRPITNSSGILSVDETGNLVLHEQDQSFIFWSTNITGVQVNNVSMAQLLDSGNLVMFQGQIKDVYSWQSFDYPSNTVLPGMKLGIDRKRGLNRVFTSWKFGVNPGVGDYSHKMELVGSPQLRSLAFFLRQNPGHDYLPRSRSKISSFRKPSVYTFSKLLVFFLQLSGLRGLLLELTSQQRRSSLGHTDRHSLGSPMTLLCSVLSPPGHFSTVHVELYNDHTDCAYLFDTVKRNEGEAGFNFKNSMKSLEGSLMEKDIGKNVDLDVFDLSTIAAATDNFSPSNKLGEGGFGSVYKGKLLNEQEIAVKRLSQSSGQGMQEFKNEVMLIAKLQHRNLVRLLGYCFHKEEKMLVYEYLPNKGLDSFIFDQEKASLLDWKKRFQIIQGIVRGLLYLHHDSRLRIIHRDLKASNVLLDSDLNPKISDFGLAKIFRGGEDEAKTHRVVGTYGYMSPEYAMEGLFSVKSDVFSFGILVLEIISGRKNNSYYQRDSVINLIGHVWDLWKQDKVLTIVDSSLGDSFDAREALLCIHIAILCVQELAIDRPTMTNVAFMLSNQETMLPSPKQPAFILRQLNHSRELGLASTCGDVGSVNTETITILQAR
ncbi:hypothetical protein R6Q59_027798 [Mikania micrantha]